MATTTTPSTSSIPAPTLCNDPLALNTGQEAPCQYENNPTCTECNGTPATNGGMFGLSKTTWIWIIVGSIVAYYMWKNRNKG